MSISHRNNKQSKHNHTTTVTRTTPQVKTKTNTECTPKQKRWLIIVQHEVIIYGEDERAAERSLSHSEFFKDRVNLKCVYISELPLHDKQEPIIDIRKAPGS